MSAKKTNREQKRLTRIAKRDANERLWEAVRAGSFARVRNALKAGADVNNEEDEDGHIPLMEAAFVGNLDI
jgi:ankyrin repeat protein